MTKLLHILFILLFALAPCVCMRAQVLDINATCETAPLINSSFSASVPAAGDYWISAWTYDLPLNLVFTPSYPVSSAPTGELDFRCGTGDYPTQELQDFFFPPEEEGVVIVTIQMPAAISFRQNTNGTYSYAIPESYRELMFQAGLTEDVQAFIKVHFPSAGSVEMNPTMDFRDCVGEGIENWTMLGDTLEIDSATVNDEFYIFPYTLWRNDSIHFVWTGNEPIVLWIGKDCNFFPDPTDEYFLDYIEINPEVSNEFKYSIAGVRSFIKSYEAVVPEGLFYVRFTSDVAGQLIVEKTPLAEAQEGAIELHLEETVVVPNDEQIYYFPRTIGSALKFTTTEQGALMSYFSEFGEFTVLDASDSLRFMPMIPSGSFVGLDEKKMTNLVALAEYEESPYIYVRFVCPTGTPITMTLWENNCAAQTNELPMNTKITIKSSGVGVHRLYYPDIKGCEIEVKWTPNTARKDITISFSNTCDNDAPAESQFELLTVSSTAYVIPAETILEWASQVDEDGYVYVRMNSSSNGKLQFTPTLVLLPDPEPEVIPDPIYPETPEPEWTGTIRLACEEENVMRVEVSEEQTLSLYEVRDHPATTPRPLPTLIEQWTQTPSDTPHELTLEPEKTYILKGLDATIRIKR